MKRIAIFASGSGTNAENLIRYFRTSPSGRVSLVLSNKPDARVIERARSLDVQTMVFNREQLYETGEVLKALKDNGIDFIVLAGFLWLIPHSVLEAYDGRIVNIHPALLPRYGGKGMYGRRVHEAVIASGDRESGISIHYVNPRYDEGDIIFQARCPVEPEDTPETLAEKIHALEYEHYPRVVEQLLEGS
ncbi:MAG: phosphoribosylglycinamide formyltransferase [Bacteroidales bacterium]